MKKIFIGGALLFMACITFVSCMGDDSKASATCSYVADCSADSLKFSDLNDTVFSDLIIESFDSLGIIGDKSRFTKYAEVDYSSINAAVFICDSLAIDEYKVVLNKYTLSEIKENMYTNHRDSLAGLGYASASELPLDHFTAVYFMYSSSPWGSISKPMAKFEKDF